MINRRRFLETTVERSALLALSATVPGFVARTARASGPERDGRILVVIELNGGNDGINTVVPFRDEGYAKYRRALRLRTRELIKIGDGVGLNPAMGDAAELLGGGRLSIVQGVGYPNPNRSHFESMAIWQSARLDPEGRDASGWLGRGLDGAGSVVGTAGCDAMSIGAGAPPLALRGRRAVASALDEVDDFVVDSAVGTRRASEPDAVADDLVAFVRRSTLDAYATADRLAGIVRNKEVGQGYPSTRLARRLGTISRLIKAGLGTRVFYTSQASYDTHYGQLDAHPTLLGELFGALRAFLDDLAAAGLAERVVVLCFSEFGRRVAENGSAGTDHGTAGPVFLAGTRVNAGLAGTYPSLTDLDDGDLKASTDFREVYAGVLEDWLGVPSRLALGGRFEPLRLLRG